VFGCENLGNGQSRGVDAAAERMLELPPVMLSQGLGPRFLAPARISPVSFFPALVQQSVVGRCPVAPMVGCAVARALWHARRVAILYGYCEVCGANAPTSFVTLRRQIGVIVARLEQRVEGHLCKACIGKYFWEFTPITVVLGWWGVTALFATPSRLLGNFRALKEARALPDAPQAETDSQRGQVRAMLETAPLGVPKRAGGLGHGQHVVTLGPPPLYLLDEKSGASAALCDGLTIGRSRERATLVLRDLQVEELHARVAREGNEFVLIDAGSGERRPLKAGMRVRIGNTSLAVINPSLGATANARYAFR
jgi:FHA domain